ncbi:MAG: ImmA/IrrE family metallo-endopeptidase [Symbiobacteriaceae bacterium]|nr:ImmA/IrrE family metallo-endopeptidase [Symbiobacteriaceae bacterium]
MEKNLNIEIDWHAITVLAYGDLLEQGYSTFPIDPLEYHRPGLHILSYQQYEQLAKVAGQPLDSRFQEYIEEGFCVDGLRPGIKLIFYDELKYRPRKDHTLFHEIGHAVCKHKKHGAWEEIVAHFYAAQIRAPNAIINELKNRGYWVTKQLLMEVFGLSDESAQKKMTYLARFPNLHPTEYDQQIVIMFAPYLNRTYPAIISMIADEYESEITDLREDWVYETRRRRL